MEFGKRFARGSALTATVAMATIVGTASADLRPPVSAQTGATAKAGKAAALAPLPAEPTFINGLAQPVFATAEADWVNYELWVQSNFDSDGDGKNDRIHVDVSRPKETDTEGLKVPVIFEDSPYYAGGASADNWIVEHELGQMPPARARDEGYFPTAGRTSPRISNVYESYFVPRGYAVVHAESPGSGHSDGCTTSGDVNETQGAVAVIDWLNGRAKGYTTRDGMDEIGPASSWHNGKAAMMGTSYNGTIPIAAATTGVEGLAAIVPVAAISDWYDYYRANGLVRAPHSASGGQNGNNGYLGEDLDVLTEYTYSRIRDTNPRTICKPVLDALRDGQDRLTGNRSAIWDRRNYMKDADKIKAATLLVHGGNDFNVMTKNAAQLWDVLKRNNVARQFYFHQGGHSNPLPNEMANRWFTKYLWGQDNGVQNEKSWVVREADACPTRATTLAGAASAATTITVADASVFRVGNQLTVPGNPTNPARTITLINGNTLTINNPITAADGTSVSLACGNANPTQYPEWPDPATTDATLKLQAGGATRGKLTFDQNSSTATETLTDDSSIGGTALMNAATSPNRLVYQTAPLKNAIRISGTPKVSLNMSFSKRANLSAALISYPEGAGNGTIVTRGWMDPENRNSEYVSEPTTAGTFYRLNFSFQAKDAVIPAGRRLALMVFSSDREYTIRPAPGTQLTLDLSNSTMTLPIVGGSGALAPAIGEGITQVPGGVNGNVPATLSLSLGAPAQFGAFTPGVARTYEATSPATVTSTAGDALLSVADPSSQNTGHLVNGSFFLPQPLQARARNAANTGTAYNNVGSSASPLNLLTWNGPISNDAVTLGFSQRINANDALRTGTYSKTLTFTLSTTQP
jgi:predicted acyl esterase